MKINLKYKLVKSKLNVIVFGVMLITLFSCVNNSDTKNKHGEKGMNISERDDYEELLEGFKNPTASARPKVYWWCLNGNIDTVRAKQELQSMKDAGIGGFDFFEIGVPKDDKMIPGGPAFLSDESLKIIKFVIDEAGELGLTVGLNLASSWNAGGSWVKPEHGAKSLYRSKISVTGNSNKQSITLPFPEVSFSRKSLVGQFDKPLIAVQDNGKPVYYEEITILAIPANIIKNTLSTNQIIDVTPYFNSENNILKWEVPPGDWEIHRYICSNSGQQLVLPSPLSDGLTIDHFDSVAVETHLKYVINKLKPVLGDFEDTALKSFYLASYEARGFVWTSTLASEFQKINGYHIYKYIPSFFDKELFPAETEQKIQTDFKKTLSELMINNLYEKSKEICNQYGLKINCEAGGPGYPLYNGPAEPLKALGSLDILRGEFWINHARYYTDNNGKDSINVLNVVKEVAAASHIYKKGIVEEEAFTSFQHWQEGPFDIKPQGDRAFCEGMNRVIFHGFSHNPSIAGYPGFAYGAGTHFNDKRVWWPKVKPFINYITRLSSIFQKTDFMADVLYYYGDKIPNAATAKNNRFSVGPGYDYEVINTEILLNDLTFENGKLTLSNGANFSILALENEDLINPKVLLKLNKLVEQGAIIVGDKPKKVATIKDQPITEENGKNLINQLWTTTNNFKNVSGDKTGKIYSNIKPLAAVTALGITPDLDYLDKESYLIDYIHYQKSGLDYYFIRNTSNKWISRNCSFRQQNKVPEIWDPVSGKIIPIIIYAHKKEYTIIPLTLPPGGSQLIVFSKTAPTSLYSTISSGGEHPPLLKFTNNGFYLLSEGKVELTGKDKKIQINNTLEIQTLEGSWEVFFPKEWGAPKRAIMPELKSWTQSEVEGIKYFSGIATYKKTFKYDIEINSEEKVFLDLGKISKVGEVWLNGEHLGITWTIPHRFNVTDIIKSGDNELIVEIANTWSNRLTGDAITGENYTSTNITKTILPTESIIPADQTRVPWAEVPLIESGLIGPVNITVVKLEK